MRGHDASVVTTNMAQDNASLLIEIGTEELPPKSLDELAAAFAAGIAGGLARREIGADAAAAKTYCSPRRLAVLVPRVAKVQPDSVEEVFGPPVSVGRDANGEPTRALQGFAKKNGVDIGALQELTKADGRYFGFRREKRGQPTASLVAEIVAESLASEACRALLPEGGNARAEIRGLEGGVLRGSLVGQLRGKVVRRAGLDQPLDSRIGLRRAVGHAHRHRPRRRQQRRIVQHLMHQAPMRRCFRRDLVAEQHHRRGMSAADEARQQPGAAAVRHGA